MKKISWIYGQRLKSTADEFPFQYILCYRGIGYIGDYVEANSVEEFIKSADFVAEYYFLKGGVWYNGYGFSYNSGYTYDPRSGFKVDKRYDERYEEGTWISLTDRMPKRICVEHGFNEKKYFEYLRDHTDNELIEKRYYASIDSLIEDAQEF